MADDHPATATQEQINRLAREIDEAELFVQRLHAYIVAIREQLTAGNTARALSMCNEALSEIDSATDVVAPSRAAPDSPPT